MPNSWRDSRRPRRQRPLDPRRESGVVSALTAGRGLSRTRRGVPDGDIAPASRPVSIRPAHYGTSCGKRAESARQAMEAACPQIGRTGTGRLPRPAAGPCAGHVVSRSPVCLRIPVREEPSGGHGHADRQALGDGLASARAAGTSAVGMVAPALGRRLRRNDSVARPRVRVGAGAVLDPAD